MFKNVFETISNIIESYSGKKVLLYTKPSCSFFSHFPFWDLVAYDCSDLWSSSMTDATTWINNMNNWFVFRSEKLIIKSSRLLFTSSDYLNRDIMEKKERHAITIENGVDYALFENSDAESFDLLKDIPRPRLGYIGGMKPKIDFSTIEKIAASKPGWSIVLIGSKEKIIDNLHASILHLNNVYSLGSVKPKDVPKYMAAMDIGLLPYKPIEYNKAVFPLKLYEYMAAGLPVVGWGLPSTKKYSDNQNYYYSDSGNMINNILDHCNLALSGRGNNSLINQRHELAIKADWNKKLDKMVQYLHASMAD